MDDLLIYSLEQIAFEGNEGCNLSRLWEIVEDFYTIYFNSSTYSIDDDFKCYFWKLFVFSPDLILNEVDSKSTLSNLILSPIKTKEIDLKLLKERYDDRIRLTVVQEKQFLAITGKELDEENKHIMRHFDILSMIFKHKEKGINQVDLAKQLNIDPRSLPSRINPLIEKGLIVKSPIIISKAQTFLLIHTRFATDSSKKYQNDLQDQQNTDNIVDINHLRTCITDILSKTENNVMRFVDLKRFCKINNKLFRRGFSRQIRSMEQLGFVERCRVVNNKGYSKCVKLIKPYNIDFAKRENQIDMFNNQDDDNSSDKEDIYDKKENDTFSELIKFSPITISRDLTLEFILFQEIKNSGKEGISGPNLKKQIIGDQWSKPLQLILDKLSVIPEKSSDYSNVQPEHLSYFSIYKEQEFVGRVNQYRYLSSLNYQAFCFENKIVNTMKFPNSGVVFPKYNESEFYLYDQNPNIFNKNTKTRSVKLGRPKKQYNAKDSEKMNLFFENSIKDNISWDTKKLDPVGKEAEKRSIDSNFMDLESGCKRISSEEINKELSPCKKLKKMSKFSTETVLTKSFANLNTSIPLNNFNTSCLRSEVDNLLSDSLIPEISKKLAFQEHIDKNVSKGNSDDEICEKKDSVSKDADIEALTLKRQPRTSLAYVRRQNLILEILDKHGGILQGGKYLNEQYNIAFKNKGYSSSEHEIDRKTMEKTLESLKRMGKIHHICVAHTNAKGTKNVFWIVADIKYNIDGVEINNFKNKILEERSIKLQTYKPLPLKIENIHVNHPVKLKKKQISLADNEHFAHLKLNNIERERISARLALREQELGFQGTSAITNQTAPSIISEIKTPFIHTFINNGKMVLERKVSDIKTKPKLKLNNKPLCHHRKLLNRNTADAFPLIGRQRLLNKINSSDKTDEIDNYEKVYRSIPIRRKNNFTSNDDDILIRAIFLSKWAYGGNAGLIDWELIKKALPHHSEIEIKSRFSTLRSKNYIKEIGNFFATSWLSHYQNAVKNKVLPPVSSMSNDLNILKFIEYSRTLDILEYVYELFTIKVKVKFKRNYDDINLPNSIEEINANYIVETVNKREDLSNNFFDASLSLNAREIILYGTAFSCCSIDEDFQEENEIKSLIKSILITPEENYDAEVAKRLLEPYEESHVELVLQKLIQDKIIVRSKSEPNRILPGRNYRFSDKFLFTFKSCFPESLFSQAFEFYTLITQEFQKNNTYTLSEFINSGSMACILDLVAHHYIQLSIENTMDVFCDNIHQYNTQSWEDYSINFSVAVQLKDISYASLDKSIKYENSLKRYVWIDISGNILKNVYDQYLQTILSLVIQRPGINIAEIISILYPAISIEEIKSILFSLTPNILNTCHGALYARELYYKSIISYSEAARCPNINRPPPCLQDQIQIISSEYFRSSLKHLKHQTLHSEQTLLKWINYMTQTHFSYLVPTTTLQPTSFVHLLRLSSEALTSTASLHNYIGRCWDNDKAPLWPADPSLGPMSCLHYSWLLPTFIFVYYVLFIICACPLSSTCARPALR
ncbi:hypothetical protein PMAC_002538 [Pneumocystis sp. 'macacae']|nr:hypothetical protein PMAC_002538 [Pneumocystis sp. 'macacae']